MTNPDPTSNEVRTVAFAIVGIIIAALVLAALWLITWSTPTKLLATAAVVLVWTLVVAWAARTPR